MTAAPGAGPLPRTPLNRDRIVRAAAAFADEHGIEALSMRKLGDAVGVEAMSLYNHIAGKEDLLDGMIDLVFSEIELPPREGWKDAMRQRAISVRTVLTRHRWAVGLMESRTSPGPATLRHHDAVLGCLRDAGFPSNWPRTPTQPSTATSTGSRCRNEACRSTPPRKPRRSPRSCWPSSPPTPIPTSPSSPSGTSSSPATTSAASTSTASA